jgi:hypothetical protein
LNQLFPHLSDGRPFQAQSTLIELAGSSAGAESFISAGYMDATLQAQYNKMMSYLADYNTWKALAVKYHCL